MALARVLTVAASVPAGASRPNHRDTLKLAIPASSSVDTLTKLVRRLLVVARAMSLSLFMWVSTLDAGENITSTKPDNTSFSACELPAPEDA